MPSLRFHLLKPLMHLARWGQGTFPVDDPQAFVRFRAMADCMANLFMRPPRQVRIEPACVGGVKGLWLMPPGAPEDPVMLFFHGGGIMFGWNNPMSREVAYIAQYAGLTCFGVDYRLVPEAVYPVAHNECYSVYRFLVGQGRQVVLIGESSGGVLALSMLLRLKAAGLPQPPLCALISPVIDYGFRDQRLWEFKDAFAHPNFTRKLHSHYVAGNDMMLPDLGPIYADLSGIAPLFVLAGEREMLRGELDRLVEAAHLYGVPIETLLWPHVWHSWHALAPQLPEATQALKALGAAIRGRMDFFHPT